MASQRIGSQQDGRPFEITTREGRFEKEAIRMRKDGSRFWAHVVIDAVRDGNDSRWINHSCRPNCVPDEVKGRIFIKTRRPVFRGEELTFDYGLVSDEPVTEALKARYACRCGAKRCRGTMLAR